LSSAPYRVPLWRNLLGGLRLVAFMPLGARHFVVSTREIIALLALTTLGWIAFDRLVTDGEDYFAWSGLAQLAWLVLVATALLAFFATLDGTGDTLARTATAVASALPFAVGASLWAIHASVDTPVQEWLPFVLATLAVVYLYRAKRFGGDPRVLAAAGALVTVFATAFVFNATVIVRPTFWYVTSKFDEETTEDMRTAEETLFRQPALVDQAVDALAAGEPGRTELYYVGFAGFGLQDVFLKEARFARDALARRIDLERRTLVLANAPQAAPDQPLASTTALRHALRGVGAKMNRDEDVLFLFLTSHGSQDASLAVSQSILPLSDLTAKDVAQALDESGIEWRIVVVSACYSGTFIEPLKNDRTLVITAARADRTSFGCADHRELTYFGEAFFRDALPQSRSLLDAAARATQLVTSKEEAEKLTPSKPQIHIGERMRAKLEELPFT
jgi:hypothetical protein